jgi:P-type Cu+ transporter
MALSSLSVVTNSNRLRGFRVRPATSASAPKAVEPVVEVGSAPPDVDVHALHVSNHDPAHSLKTVAVPGEMERQPAIDPVCGMSVHPVDADYRSVHDGQTYYFCSLGCKEGFEKDPGQFVGAAKTGRAGA